MDAEKWLFVGLVAGWVLLRFLTRRWVYRRVQQGTMTKRSAARLVTFELALIPWIALPWLLYPLGIAILVVATAIILASSTVFSKLIPE